MVLHSRKHSEKRKKTSGYQLKITSRTPSLARTFRRNSETEFVDDMIYVSSTGNVCSTRGYPELKIINPTTLRYLWPSSVDDVLPKSIRLREQFGKRKSFRTPHTGPPSRPNESDTAVRIHCKICTCSNFFVHDKRVDVSRSVTSLEIHSQRSTAFACYTFFTGIISIYVWI